MVQFYVSFLICVPLSLIKSKAKAKKAPKKANKKGKGANEVAPVTEENVNRFEVGSANYVGHFEYTILKGVLQYSVDILFWENVAKVFTADGTKCVKTIICEELCWVSFSVGHSTVFTNSNLEELYEEEVTFSFWPDRKKLSPKASQNNPKAFYINPNHSNNKEEIVFMEAFEEGAPPQEFPTGKKFLHPDVGEIITIPSALPYEKYWKRNLSAIENVTKIKKDEEIAASALVSENDENVTDKEKNRNQKKKEKSPGGKKKKKENNMTLTVKAEAFFTDRQEVYCEMRGSDVYFMSIGVAVQQFMTEAQMTHFNPIIIRVEKLKNLPVEVIKNKKIVDLYVTYKILSLDPVETARKPLETDMVFDETHVILTHTLSRFSVLEFLQTGYILMEIYGTCELSDSSGIQPSLFGQEEVDLKLSCKSLCTATTRHEHSILKHVNFQPSNSHLLAVAKFQLFELLVCDCYSIEMTCPLMIPPVILRDDNAFCPDSINANISCNNQCEDLLSNGVLIENNTKLKIVVKMVTSLLDVSLTALASPDLYNRLFIMLKCRETAVNIINDIYDVNKYYLGDPAVIPNYLKGKPLWKEIRNMPLDIGSQNYLEQNEPTLKQDDHSDIEDVVQGLPQRLLSGYRHALTGFIIDNFHDIFIFVEGLSNGKLRKVWHSAQNLNPETGDVLFNSDLIFQSRLYEDFLPYGGLYIVTMKECLEKKITKPDIFLEGNVPSQCWKLSLTLLQLDHLSQSTSMRQACYNNLFPTADGLLNFDIEFGVPLYT